MRCCGFPDDSVEGLLAEGPPDSSLFVQVSFVSLGSIRKPPCTDSVTVSLRLFLDLFSLVLAMDFFRPVLFRVWYVKATDRCLTILNADTLMNSFNHLVLDSALVLDDLVTQSYSLQTIASCPLLISSVLVVLRRTAGPDGVRGRPHGSPPLMPPQ